MKLKVVTKEASNGNVRLLLSYHCQTGQLFATGVIVPIEDFKEGHLENPVARTNPKADFYNQQITLLYHEVQQIISTLRREDKIPTADLVHQIHQDKKRVIINKPSKRSFGDVFQTLLSEKDFTASTLKLYYLMYARLTECFPNLNIEEFDNNDWMKFRKHITEVRSQSTNTACIRLNKLKAMLKHLKRNGMEIPIRSFPLPKEEVKKIFLDLKDLKKVMDFIPLSTAQQKAKDLFVLQCHTALRISDLSQLEKMHIRQVGESYFIQMTAYKTNKPLMIPLNQVVVSILQKYDFALPRLTEQYYKREIKHLIRLAGVTTTFEWQAYDLKGNKVYKAKPVHELFTNHCCSERPSSISFQEAIHPIK